MRRRFPLPGAWRPRDVSRWDAPSRCGQTGREWNLNDEPDPFHVRPGDDDGGVSGSDGDDGCSTVAVGASTERRALVLFGALLAIAVARRARRRAYG